MHLMGCWHQWLWRHSPALKSQACVPLLQAPTCCLPVKLLFSAPQPLNSVLDVPRSGVRSGESNLFLMIVKKKNEVLNENFIEIRNVRVMLLQT